MTENNHKRKRPNELVEQNSCPEKLLELLKLDPNVELSKLEITKLLIAYMRQNNLLNGVMITPNNELRQALMMDNIQQLSIFDLQKYLNQLFASKETKI